MEYPKLYSTLESIIDSGNNPYDLNYWTPVYFHPYTSLVVGEWISDNNGSIELEYNRFSAKVKGLGNLSQFKDFMFCVQKRVTAMGWVLPVDAWRKESCISHSWDNKVCVSLLGKNEEVLVLGWKDWNLCIGVELTKPYMVGDGKSYTINTDPEEFI